MIVWHGLLSIACVAHSMRGGGGVGVLSIACVAAAEDALNADETAQRWVALERASKLDERLSGGDRVSPHF